MKNATTPAPSWHERAASLAWDGRPLIHGERVDIANTLTVFSPATGQPLYELALCPAEVVERAVLSARQVFQSGEWSGISPQARQLKLLRLAALIAEHHEELALRDTLEMGKPISSSLEEVGQLAPSMCRFYAEAADKLYGDVAGSDSACLAFSLREPRGVVAAIAPWNYPLPNAALKVMPALATGNCVVLKPSELASGSALRLGELALEAGIPAGVLNIVTGDGPVTGAALASHPLVNMVTFTGSTATGRAIMSMASRATLRPVMLECGGKSPQIVFADAPEAGQLAPRLLAEAFANQGQLCVARSRLLVHQSRAGELIEALEAEARRYAVGDPLDAATSFGPLAGTRQFQRVTGFITQARQDGASMITGGEAGRHCGVLPTLFHQVTPDMAIVREEVFGPVMTIQCFQDLDEAVHLANATPYGLAASVWTSHTPTARTMIRQLRTGHVSVNSGLAPFEGPGMALSGEPRGDSGFGCESGLDSLRSYTAVKGVILA